MIRASCPTATFVMHQLLPFEEQFQVFNALAVFLHLLVFTHASRNGCNFIGMLMQNESLITIAHKTKTGLWKRKPEEEESE